MAKAMNSGVSEIPSNEELKDQQNNGDSEVSMNSTKCAQVFQK